MSIITPNDKRLPCILSNWGNVGLRYLGLGYLLFVRREWFRIIGKLLWVILCLLELINAILIMLISIFLKRRYILLFQVWFSGVILLKNLIVFFLILIYYSHFFWVLFLRLRLPSDGCSHSFLFLLVSIRMLPLV